MLLGEIPLLTMAAQNTNLEARVFLTDDPTFGTGPIRFRFEIVEIGSGPGEKVLYESDDYETRDEADAAAKAALDEYRN